MSVEYQLGLTRGSPSRGDALARTMGWPMTSIGPFGLSPDVRLLIRIDRASLKYTVEGALATILSRNHIAVEGQVSEFGEVTLTDVDRRHKHIPFGATEYTFLYPLTDLANATSNQLHACFGDSSTLAPCAAALRFGAFAFLDQSGKVTRINALMEDDSMASGFFLFHGPFVLPQEVRRKLSARGLLQQTPAATRRQHCAVSFAWIRPNQFPEVGLPNGGFAYIFENPSHDRYFRLADQHVLFGSFRKDRLKNHQELPQRNDRIPNDLERILQTSAGFALGYPATNKAGTTFSLQNQVPFQLRMTSAFLVAIGRNPNDKFTIVKSGKGHYEYEPDEPEPLGLRWVSLSSPLYLLKDPVVWSSKNAEKWLREWYTDPVIDECLASLKIESLEEMYGSAEYTIPAKQLIQYEQSTVISLGELLPPFFYRSILALTGDTRFIQYFWETKSFPLSEFVKPVSEQDPSLAASPVARDSMGTLLKRVTFCPLDFGFKDVNHMERTFERSLTELSTGVVISQDGQFLLGNYNQITEPTPTSQPILFLATAAIDFDEPDRHPAAEREEQRYFTITERCPDGSVKGQWRSPEARAELKERLKIMYDMLFTRCAQARVTHPSFLPIGLGIFLPRIESSSVKSIYHEAQFELLSEKDYKFQYYFLNPGPGRREAEALLEKYTFFPEVVLHTKNSKFLSAELARAGYRTCCLNPSDCIAMMSGCMGYWWEVGKGSRYVGEEDIVATSTFVLASKGISTVFDSARIQSHIYDPHR